MRDGNGKRGQAPCGHEGECVIGTFYRCLQGCRDDSVLDFVLEEPTPVINRCPFCMSENVKPFVWYMPNGWHCIDCGKVHNRP